MALSKLAAQFAAEIRNHDWSDAPYRMDRAGRFREADRGRQLPPQLMVNETNSVRVNVMWVTAQVLGYNDPNFDPVEFAQACGVEVGRGGHITDGGVLAGLRTRSERGGAYAVPGTYEYGEEPPSQPG